LGKGKYTGERSFKARELEKKRKFLNGVRTEKALSLFAKEGVSYL